MRVTRRKVMRKPRAVCCKSECLHKTPNYKNDLSGILLLTFLYILQGIPLGLAAAIPYLLQSDAHTANYKYQAIFSWVFWPFSLKLAWAPIVDSLYFRRLGRRKSWLIPIQYAIGIDLFVLAGKVNAWLGRPAGQNWGPLGVAGDVQIWSLTCAFFGLTLLAATQDIVVDGWALTMLSKENVGWASTCNSVGQSLGYIIAFIVFLALESPEICNNYLRFTPVPGQGLISFSGFLYFWGVVFVLSTTVVAIFKSEVADSSSRRRSSGDDQSHLLAQDEVTGRVPLVTTRGDGSADEEEDGLANGAVLSSPQVERRESVDFSDNCNHASMLNESRLILQTDKEEERERRRRTTSDGEGDKKEDEETERHLSLIQTYHVMLGVLRLRPVLKYIVFVFFVKFVFSASDNVFGLKLLENGLSKERLALMGTIVLPLQAILPLVVTPWSNGPRPLSTYLFAALPRALLASLTVAIVHYMPYFRQVVENATGPPTYVFSTAFYVLVLCKMLIYSTFSHVMFVCQMAYHARVSDPSIGGTYMTLLNTAANLAGSLPATLMLYLVDPLTWHSCDGIDIARATSIFTNATAAASPVSESVVDAWISSNATCKAAAGIEACKALKGTCHTIVDGFYIEVGFCILVGVVSYFAFLRSAASKLDRLPVSSYRYRRAPPACCRRD
nr:unnamed protein product [Spirometra erinaceieuropaei]